jgi:hypothetical protein
LKPEGSIVCADDIGRYIKWMLQEKKKKGLWEIYGSVKVEEEKRQRREDTYTD